MSQEPASPSVSTLLLTFLVGAAAGAVAVALTTPKTGPQLRGGLKHFGRRAKP
jgi:gas vesicle protein